MSTGRVWWGRRSLQVVKEGTEGSIVKASRHRVQQGIKGGWIRYALHGYGPDVLGGEELELDAVDGGGNGECWVHGEVLARTAPASGPLRGLQTQCERRRHEACRRGQFFELEKFAKTR